MLPSPERTDEAVVTASPAPPSAATEPAATTEPTSARPVVAAEQMPFAPPTPSPRAPDGSILKRRDAPPEGVADQLVSFGGAAGSLCIANPDGDPAVEVRPDPSLGPAIEIGEPAQICLTGFDPNQPYLIEIQLPDGQVQRSDADAPYLYLNSYLPRWLALPGDPAGDYFIAVTQGDHGATSQFTVAMATAPSILVRNLNVTSGGVVQLVLAGFSPNQPAQLYLYHEMPNYLSCFQSCFIAALPPIDINERGEANYMIQTEADDDLGWYLVEASPPLSTTTRHLRRFFLRNPSGQAPAGQSLLQRREPPPAGVGDLLVSFPSMGGRPCLDETSDHPRITTPKSTVIQGGRIVFCLVKFDPTRPIALGISDSAGNLWRGWLHPVSSSDVEDFGWEVPLDASLGEYRLIATQGEIQADTSFTVTPATYPSLAVTPAVAASPGTTFRITLAGYPPKTKVQLYLYRAEDPGRFYRYSSALPPVQIDADGRATFIIQTMPDDLPGEYRVITDDDARDKDLRNWRRSSIKLAQMPSYPGALIEGSQSEAVKQLQERLLALGFAVNRNGALDSLTVTAVKAFQDINGLLDDQVVGRHTWERLFSAEAIPNL